MKTTNKITTTPATTTTTTTPPAAAATTTTNNSSQLTNNISLTKPTNTAPCDEQKNNKNDDYKRTKNHQL